MKVDGYTDAKGSDAYNLGLSGAGAQAVAGRAPERARRRRTDAGGARAWRGGSRGGEHQKDGSDNPKGRARNRRVTITFPR